MSRTYRNYDPNVHRNPNAGASARRSERRQLIGAIDAVADELAMPIAKLNRLNRRNPKFVAGDDKPIGAYFELDWLGSSDCDNLLCTELDELVVAIKRAIRAGA